MRKKEKSSGSGFPSGTENESADIKPIVMDPTPRYNLRSQNDRVLVGTTPCNVSGIHLEYLSVCDGPLDPNEEVSEERGEKEEEEELLGFDLSRLPP